MTGITQPDGGTDERTDDRIEAVETITIDFEEFKKALEFNYLTDYDRRRGGNTVLRLYPPFEGEMNAEKYFSEEGVRYANDWNEKPMHIRPHLVLQDGDTDALRGLPEWPTKANTRDVLTEDEITDYDGGIDEAVEEAREFFWNELRHSLPSEFAIGASVSYYGNKTVNVEWEFEE